MPDNIILRVQAPMAVSRPLVTNHQRGTYQVLSPSLIYGLICNIAGIETRIMKEGSVSYTMRDDVPPIDFNIGYTKMPITSTVYEHTLKLMQNSNELAKLGDARINKCRQSIQPKRTSYLYGIDMYIIVHADEHIIRRIHRYMDGILDPMMNTPDMRYGGLFLGSNNCILSSLAVVDTVPEKLYWMVDTTSDTKETHIISSMLPIWIDREFPTKTTYGEFSIMHQNSIGSTITVGPRRNP